MRNLFKPLFAAVLLSVGIMLLYSCNKDKEDAFGILSMSLTMPTGQTIGCAVDQNTRIISNTSDPLEPGMAQAMYLMKVSWTATIGTTVYFGADPVESGITEIDFSSPVSLTAKKDGKEILYTVKLVEDADDDSQTKGKRVNADMRNAGFPNCAYYDITAFKGQFYAITSTFPEGTANENPAYYNVYKSADGISWTKVSTNIKVVGAYGARLVVFKDKLWAVGGGYLYGVNEDGYGPELMWGLPGFFDIADLYIFSSEDGENWNKETAVNDNGVVSGYMDIRLIPSADRITYYGGMASAFGQFQKTYNVATTSDGFTWTGVDGVDMSGAANLTGCGAIYPFNGKLYLAGGFQNFISADYARTAVCSSADGGLTWTEETADGGFGAMWNMRVAGNDKVLYMVGGEYFVEGGSDAEGNPASVQTASSKVYRSEDGVHWTALEGEYELPATFTGRTRPCLVVVGDMLWIFGGRGVTNGYYGGIAIADEVLFDTWKKKIQ